MEWFIFAIICFLVGSIFAVKKILGGKSLEEKASEWDAKFAFPRPANEQYLSSHKAFLRLSKDFVWGLLYLTCFLVSCFIIISFWQVFVSFGFNHLFSFLLIIILIVFSILFLAFDLKALNLAYSLLFQRDSKGSSRWANLKLLKDKKIVFKNGIKLPEKMISIVPFGLRHTIAVEISQLAQHIIVLGVSGSGKTSTFFMNLARSFATKGSLIALDISKTNAGEFFAYTSSYFDDVFRFDLNNPAFSDFFYLFEGCKGNAQQAGKIAGFIIGKEGNKAGGDDIWDTAAEMMLKCLILHLCEFETATHFPTPSDIFQFLADHPSDGLDENGKKENKLKIVMEKSPNEDVRVEWKALFAAVGDASPRTYGSIVFTLMAKLGIFRDSAVREVLRPPTPQEYKLGRKKIDFHHLRKLTNKNPFHKDGIKRGKAIYIIVKEGEASRLKTVIAAFLGLAKDILKQSGQNPEDAHILFALDEAGNVPIPGLSEDFGVGRGRRMIFALGLQGISQLAKQYGNEVAKTILENTGMFLIFPGAKDETARWVSRMLGNTTILSRAANDAVSDKFDSERLTEESRPLMFDDEVRRLKWFHQCILVINDIFPILARINDDAKKTDPRVFTPIQKIPLNPKKIVSQIPQSKESEMVKTENEMKIEVIENQTPEAVDGYVVMPPPMENSSIEETAPPALIKEDADNQKTLEREFKNV